MGKHDGLIAKFGCLLETKSWKQFKIGSQLKATDNADIGTLDELRLYRWEPNGVSTQPQTTTNGLSVTTNHKRTKSAAPSNLSAVSDEIIASEEKNDLLKSTPHKRTKSAMPGKNLKKKKQKKTVEKPKAVKTSTPRKRSSHSRTKSAMPASNSRSKKKPALAKTNSKKRKKKK